MLFFSKRSQRHSLIVVGSEEIKKVIGVNSNVVKNIRHKEYVILFNKNFIKHIMKRIQSKLHKIGTYDLCKISLSCFDDKRCILNDGINSLHIFIEVIKLGKVDRINKIKQSQ